jgi:drug/metabolite transporter (DMT)-like permease
MFVFEEPTMANILAAKIPILYCGLMSVGIAYTLQVVAQTKVPASLAVIVLSTESVFSVIGGIIFGIDPLSIFVILGCVLIFSGIVLSQLPVNAKRKE